MAFLKEYAGAIMALVTVVAAVAALGLWTIHAQITPEIRRLDGRIDNYEILYGEITGRLGRMDDRLDRVEDRLGRVEKRLDRVEDRFERLEQRLEARFNRLDDRFQRIDDRFKEMDARFAQMESRFEDMADNVKLILAKLSAPADQAKP